MKNSILNNENINKTTRNLTQREIEYLALVALGLSNNKIAEKLFVTTSTVKKTLENIFRKLNAHDRANAVALAFSYEFLNAKIISDVKNNFLLP